MVNVIKLNASATINEYSDGGLKTLDPAKLWEIENFLDLPLQNQGEGTLLSQTLAGPKDANKPYINVFEPLFKEVLGIFGQKLTLKIESCQLNIFKHNTYGKIRFCELETKQFLIRIGFKKGF